VDKTEDELLYELASQRVVENTGSYDVPDFNLFVEREFQRLKKVVNDKDLVRK